MSNTDSKTKIGICVRASPTENLNCFDPLCTFASPSLNEVEDHIRIKHNNNHELKFEVLLFFSTFREGRVLESVNPKENAMLGSEEEKKREGIEKKSVGKKRRREAMEEGEKNRDDCMTRSPKKTKNKRVDIESKNGKGPKPPPRLLRPPKRLTGRSVNPLNLQPSNSPAPYTPKPLNISEDDDIECEDETELDPSLPPPNQLVFLQSRKPLLFHPVV